MVLSPDTFKFSLATQEYVLVMLLVRAKFNVSPEHIVPEFALVITGKGLTEIVTV
jgi:phenolic acid decarboxylase